MSYPGTVPASYRWSSRNHFSADTFRPVAVEERADELIDVLDLDLEVEAMVHLRCWLYPVAPKGSTPARYTLNN